MKCFFNSCPLNEEYYLKQYKKAYPDTKELFLSLNPNDEIIKASKLVSNSKKYHFCIEHIEKLNLYKTVKEKLELIPSSSSAASNQAELRTTLEQLNTLIRYDDNIKSLCFKIEKIDLVSLILSQLAQSDRTISMLLFLNLSHILKEISYAKKYSTNDLYLSITDYYCNYIYSPYEEMKLFSIDEKERMMRDALLYGLLVNNITYIIVNAKEKGLRLDITTKVIVKAMELIATILTESKPKLKTNDSKTNNDYLQFLGVINKIIISSLLKLIYALLISKNSQINLNTSIVNVFCKLSKEAFDYVKQANDCSLKKEFMILLNELLYSIIHIQSDQLEIENVRLFIKESESLLTSEEKNDNGLIEEKIRSNVIEVKEKIRIHSNVGMLKVTDS